MKNLLRLAACLSVLAMLGCPSSTPTSDTKDFTTTSKPTTTGADDKGGGDRSDAPVLLPPGAPDDAKKMMQKQLGGGDMPKSDGRAGSPVGSPGGEAPPK